MILDRSIRCYWITLAALLAITCLTPNLVAAVSKRPLPALRDGATLAGPGTFAHQGTLQIEGKVVLRDLDLELEGPIVVSAGAHFELSRVRLTISDPPGQPHGTSGLSCLGPASIIIRDSSMSPLNSAHPMWSIEGHLDVNGFRTLNSELHLKHTDATVNQLKIFELEISAGSKVTGHDLDLVFFSTQTGDREDLAFSAIPTAEPFSRQLHLGSGALADLKDARVEIFLIYIHGQSKLHLSDMGRVQLAMYASCHGTMQLPIGVLGTKNRPAIFPDPHSSDCPFQFSLQNVKVDTWDVYAGAHADLRFSGSVIDELTASSQAHIEVTNSILYADWLAIEDDARVTVKDSIVGSLRLAPSRPDLATSQVRLSGQSRAAFSRVRFDCGIYAGDHALATIIAPLALPAYQKVVGSGASSLRRRVVHRPTRFDSVAGCGRERIRSS